MEFSLSRIHQGIQMRHELSFKAQEEFFPPPSSNEYLPRYANKTGFTTVIAFSKAKQDILQSTVNISFLVKL